MKVQYLKNLNNLKDTALGTGFDYDMTLCRVCIDMVLNIQSSQ
jgi:hypothetical protein